MAVLGEPVPKAKKHLSIETWLSCFHIFVGVQAATVLSTSASLPRLAFYLHIMSSGQIPSSTTSCLKVSTKTPTNYNEERLCPHSPLCTDHFSLL